MIFTVFTLPFSSLSNIGKWDEGNISTKESKRKPNGKKHTHFSFSNQQGELYHKDIFPLK